MRQCVNWQKFLLCFTLLFSTALYAEGANVAHRLDSELQEENPKESSHLMGEAFQLDLCHKNGETKDLASAFTSTVYLNPIAADCISDIGIAGDWIVSGNGCLWSVSYCDEWVAAGWWPGDVVYITQSECSVSGYIMINQTRSTAVHVSRDTSPHPFSSAVRTIIDIDPFYEEVMLSDGTVWDVTEMCHVWNHWCLGDQVILGVNSNGYSTYYPFILINVSMNPFCVGGDDWVMADLY